MRWIVVQTQLVTTFGLLSEETGEVGEMRQAVVSARGLADDLILEARDQILKDRELLDRELPAKATPTEEGT